MRFHEIDALPITVTDSERRRRAVYGYSSLARLLRMSPKSFAKFLGQPCLSVSDVLATVDATDGLKKVFRTFERTKFGFAWVEDGDNPGGFVGLHDVLGLYETGAIRSELRIGEVASPIFSIPAVTSLRDSLSMMFARRYRRMFFSPESGFISDRTIIERIFSPAVLQSYSDGSGDVLQIPALEVERLHPKSVSSELTVAQGARELHAKPGQCLVCEKGVVTPWDLVMKPWSSKALIIAE